MGAQAVAQDFSGTSASVTPLSSNGEGDEGNDGHEGNEEEVCEQGRSWPLCKSHGAPWLQGEDCWRLDCQGFDQVQERQDCEQEEERQQQEEPMDCCRQEGACCPEDQGLLRHQEGQPPLRQGEGVLLELSAQHTPRISNRGK